MLVLQVCCAVRALPSVKVASTLEGESNGESDGESDGESESEPTEGASPNGAAQEFAFLRCKGFRHTACPCDSLWYRQWTVETCNITSRDSALQGAVTACSDARVA